MQEPETETASDSGSDEPPAKGASYAVAILGVGHFFVAIHEALTKTLAGSYSPFQILFLRSIVTVLVFLLIVRVRDWTQWFSLRQSKLLYARSGLFFVSYISGILALKLLPFAQALTIIYFSPVLTAVLGWLLLKESMTYGRTIALLGGFSGVVIASVLEMPEFGLGLVVAFVCAGTKAVANIITAIIPRTKSSSGLGLHAAMFFLVATAFAQPVVWVDPPIADLGIMLGLGVLGALMVWVGAEAYRHGDVSLLTPVEYSTIVWGALLGYFFWGEVPNVSTVVGGIMIAVSASSLAWRSGSKS